MRFDTYNGSRRSRYLKVARNESHLIVLDALGRERARLVDIDGIESVDEIVDFLARNAKLKRLGQDDPPGSPSAEPKDSQKR